MPKLNLEEIGRLAGVSRSTVSRVVNGSPNVSPDARTRVEAVIAQTGYRPHAAARSLASNRTDIIGLVIPSAIETLFDDPYFGRLILGVSGATNLAGTTLSLFLFSEESDDSVLTTRVLGPGLVDGVIITATQLDDPLIEELHESGVPFVVVGRPDGSRPVFSVDVDNRSGARLAAEHLIGLGYRRIGMITAPLNTAAGIDRKMGFLAGLAAAGIDVAGRVYEGAWSEESGRAAMADLLEAQPDAVFVGSDRMAVGALRAIREAGLRCPEDVAVVSFDGIIPPDQTVPRLTAVAQPVFDNGRRAAKLLDAVIRRELTQPEQIVLPTELVIRESCGAVIRGAVPS
jgi:LacI family transcriptional regulator